MVCKHVLIHDHCAGMHLHTLHTNPCFQGHFIHLNPSCKCALFLSSPAVYTTIIAQVCHAVHLPNLYCHSFANSAFSIPTCYCTLLYMQEKKFCCILESTSEQEASSNMIKGKLAQAVKLLVKKKDSLLGLQRLYSALLETQQEMSGVKECIGEPWFRPWWQRFALLQNRG